VVSLAYPPLRVSIYLTHYHDESLNRNLTRQETGGVRHATTGQGVSDCVMIGTQCHQIICFGMTTTGAMNDVVRVQ
jgi:hypothetical protein